MAMKKLTHLIVFEKPFEDESSDWSLPISFDYNRHNEKIEKVETLTHKWRMKERMKTVSVALVLCLNVGVDPPDIVKTQPCARLECWIDPLAAPPPKALESIGNNLQKQYERWQPRARYKQSLDPTVDEIKKLCQSLRRNAKEERVLFHYNGHGVPRPTGNGEIWVFNKNYTQYIPLSIYDLQSWMGSPSIYVFDCSNAGIIIESFKHFASQHEEEYETAKLNQRSAAPNGANPFNESPPPSYANCIQLAACSDQEILPMNPDLPADLFTSCLTTPIKIALRWFVMQRAEELVPEIRLELIDKIPGMLNDRRTMLGELNWIFTAITDTIAWNTLSKDLFQKLFRQDLLVASLFRNFLLAERIMRTYNCTPVSSPKLPQTYHHPMWQAWDLALDVCLSQLDSILNHNATFKHSPFFEEQLTAFEVWLSHGTENRQPPEQLPIVLQVLLSQVHRLKALDLLGQFLDLGPWAVNLALSVGIFPYVLKLLQSNARELRPLLVFIWAKILAVDNTCQSDLVRDNSQRYFVTILSDLSMESKHRSMAAFVMATIVNQFKNGQEAALQGGIVSICLDQLNDPNPLLRQWLSVCLGRTWANYDTARWCGVRDSAHEKLFLLLEDHVPEVRAAAVFALGTFVYSISDRNDHANMIDHSIIMKLINTVSQDGSPIVRKEFVVALHWFVLLFENQVVSHAVKVLNAERQTNIGESSGASSSSMSQVYSGHHDSSLNNNVVINRDKLRKVSSSSSLSSLVSTTIGNIYANAWKTLISLTMDPVPDVARVAYTILEYIHQKALVSVQNEESSARHISSSPQSSKSYLAESPPTIMMVSSSPKDRPSGQKSLSSSPNPSGRTPSQPLPQYKHSVQFTMTRKIFDKGPDPKPLYSELDGELKPKKALITTEFLDWSAKYFAQTITNKSPSIDPESSLHNTREWRYIRNSNFRNRTNEDLALAGADRLEDQIFINKNSGVPTVIKLHPFEPHFAVADKDSVINVWDWDHGSIKSTYNNMNPKGTQITSLNYINAHDTSLLLVGSDDGAMRVWRNYASSNYEEPILVTAWQALSDMIPSARASGLVVAWEQNKECLLASGDVRVVRLWDVNKEVKIQDLPTGAGSCVSTISSDASYNAMVVVGCGDGSVRLFDRRLPPIECRVMTMREHVGWVVNVFMQMNQNSRAKIISGSLCGEIKFWDPRSVSSVQTLPTTAGMTAMSVHPTADLIACASVNQHTQHIGIYNSKTVNKSRSYIKFHDGFMGQRIGPVSCIDFHQYQLNLIAGSTDSFISLFSSEVTQRR